MGCYSRLMVTHPFIFIVVDVMLAVILGPLPVWIFGVPDFSNPTKGFEPRGTQLNIWGNVGFNIYTDVENGNLSRYPLNLMNLDVPRDTDQRERITPTRKKRFTVNSLREIQTCAFVSLSNTNHRSKRIVVTSKTGSRDIFNVQDMHSICRLQDKWSNDFDWPGKECQMLSLPFFITVIANKTSCYDINETDIRRIKSILVNCAAYYFSGILTPYCELYGTCPIIHKDCFKYNAVYIIMHMLTDTGFFKNKDTRLRSIEFSLVIIPSHWARVGGIERSEMFGEFYMKHFDKKVVEEGNITVPAMHLGAEQEVFNEYVIGDIPYYALAMSLVIVILLVYLQSVVLMIAVVLNVFITLCLSYFIYHYICQLHFFPFVNLIAALLLIAVSADDVFILVDLWKLELRENPTDSYEEIMSETLRKGGMSIFVTSLTTATALISNLISDITTVRLFGIFSGICMVVNFILMITWIPALIILIEKCMIRCIPDTKCQGGRNCAWKLTRAWDHFWGEIMFPIITSGAAAWVLLLIPLAILGCIGVFVWPAMKLPKDSSLKIFNPDHPFEIYSSKYQEHIRFEQELRNTLTIGIQIVWGVEDVDTGNWLDPNNKGPLVYKPIDIYSPDAREWLNNFCHTLQKQPFIHHSYKDMKCVLEFVETLIAGPCLYGRYTIAPCCNTSKPLSETTMRRCVPYLMNIMRDHFKAGWDLGDLLFDRNGTLRIFRYKFHNVRSFTTSFAYMKLIVDEMDNFTRTAMIGGPGTLKEGWYTTFTGYQFKFYNLQEAISYGTLMGMGTSLLTGFVVLLITSANVVTSIYAIITISMVIAVTVGTLAMLGWELGVIESLTITLSLGLAVDFTIHYGVAYNISQGSTRAQRVKYTVRSVSPAVTMAALTTFISGAAIMPGQVLAYRQFGLFLMLIMSFSWVYATFFFLPVCYGIGPTGNVGDIMYLFRKCKLKRKKSQRRSEQALTVTRSFQSITGETPLPLTSSNVSLPSDVFVRKPKAIRPSSVQSHSSFNDKFMMPGSDMYDNDSKTRRAPHGRDDDNEYNTVTNRRRHYRFTHGTGSRSASRRPKEPSEKIRGRKSCHDRETNNMSDNASNASTPVQYVYNIHVHCLKKKPSHTDRQTHPDNSDENTF